MPFCDSLRYALSILSKIVHVLRALFIYLIKSLLYFYFSERELEFFKKFAFPSDDEAYEFDKWIQYLHPIALIYNVNRVNYNPSV